MITVKVSGHVRELETGLPLPGLTVEAYDKDLIFDDYLGAATTNFAGHYTITSDVSQFQSFFDKKPDIYLRILPPGGGNVLFSTEDSVKWNASADEICDVAVPRDALGPFAPPRTIDLIGDDGSVRADFEIGEPLRLRCSGLAPGEAHNVLLRNEAGTPFITARLMSDTKGRIRDEVVWPQIGLDDPGSNAQATVEEAMSLWGGRTFRLEVLRRDTAFFEVSLETSSQSTRPLVLSVDEEGRPRRAIQAGSDDLIIAGANFPPNADLQLFIVTGRFNRRTGDAFDAGWLQTEIRSDAQGRFTMTLEEAGSLAAGSYDIIVRAIEYGEEVNDEPNLLADDVVGFRGIEGFRVRGGPIAEGFVPNGGANLQRIAGRSFSAAPYFQHADVFEPGEEVWAALDPAALDPEHQGKMAALYLVEHKSASSWSADPGLNHLGALGGNGAVPLIMVQAGSAASGMHLLWPHCEPGEYDIVADFGNNTANAAEFATDASYDQPLDLIDGYVVAGFRVLTDPTVVTDFDHCGSFTYDEPNTTVSDDSSLHDPYLGEEPSIIEYSVPVRGVVYFPADAPGVTDPEQISVTQTSYPIFVIMHGAHPSEESYLGYNYLLEHLAKNGFIAASIFMNPLMRIRGRAELLFQHLDRLKEIFSVRAQDRIAVMGHSRGGEAAVRASQDALNPAINHTIEAVISLSPTDRYGRLILGEAAARPYLVIYGSHDGDVVGDAPNTGGVPRYSGFSLHDRAYGAPKSMVFVYGALHGPFNTVWGPVDHINLPFPDNYAVIDEQAHRTVAQAYVTAFLRQHMRGDDAYEGMIRGDWIPASVMQANEAAMRVFVQYQGLDRFPIDSMVGNAGPEGWTNSTVGGTVTDDGSLPEDPLEDWLHEIDFHSPHESGGMRFRWNGTQDRLRFELPEPRNVSGFRYLSFRVTQTVDSATNPNGPQDFFVSLTDQGGNSRQVRVGQFAEIPEPAARQDTDDWTNVTKSSMRTVRLPLSAFSIAVEGAEPVNTMAIVEIGFHFGVLSSGELIIDTVAFADGGLPPDDILPPGGVVPPSEIARPPVLADRPSPAALLPDAPRTARYPLKWEACEVVRKFNGRPRLLLRLTLHAPRFMVRALEPIVRVGDRTAVTTEMSTDGRRLHAYFDEAIPDGATIDYGFEDRGIIYRSPDAFASSAVDRLDRSRLSKEVILPYA